MRLAAVTTAGEHVVPRLLASFGAQYPEAEVSLEVGNRARVWDLLEHREVDLAFGGGRRGAGASSPSPPSPTTSSSSPPSTPATPRPTGTARSPSTAFVARSPSSANPAQRLRRRRVARGVVPATGPGTSSPGPAPSWPPPPVSLPDLLHHRVPGPQGGPLPARRHRLTRPPLRSGTQPPLRSGTQPPLRSGTQPPLRSGR